MIPVSMPRISQAIREAELPEVDLVVGIATGGTVPASLLAYRLGVEMQMLPLNYRDEDNTPRYEHPKLVGPRLSLPETARRLLLVDDVSVTGSTLEYARSLLPDRPVTTLVMKGKADIVLLPEISECVDWPWKASQSKATEDQAEKG